MGVAASVPVALVATAAGVYLLVTSAGGGTIAALWGVVFGLVFTIAGLAIGIGIASRPGVEDD